jgi:hypothetical protein
VYWVYRGSILKNTRTRPSHNPKDVPGDPQRTTNDVPAGDPGQEKTFLRVWSEEEILDSLFLWKLLVDDVRRTAFNGRRFPPLKIYVWILSRWWLQGNPWIMSVLGG